MLLKVWVGTLEQTGGFWEDGVDDFDFGTKWTWLFFAARELATTRILPN